MTSQEKIQKLRELLIQRGDIPGLSYFIDYRESRNAELFRFLTRNIPMQDLKKKRVLDVGCGTGAFLEHLQDKGLDAIGIDVDKEKLRVGFGRDTCVCDASHLPFRDSTFDFVISIDAIEHIPNQGTAITNMLSKLKTNGEILVLTNNRLFPFDSDTKLFFVNYMPKYLADRYLRLRKKKSDIEYDIKYPTYATFPRLIKKNKDSKTKVIGIFTIFGLYVEEYKQLKILAAFVENTIRRWKVLGFLQLFAPKLALRIKKMQ